VTIVASASVAGMAGAALFIGGVLTANSSKKTQPLPSVADTMGIEEVGAMPDNPLFQASAGAHENIISA